MLQPIRVPCNLWPALVHARKAYKAFDTNWVGLVRWCLAGGPDTRLFGEWLCDEIGPAGWKQGVTHGFIQYKKESHHEAQA
jgi:hypothetical protein